MITVGSPDGTDSYLNQNQEAYFRYVHDYKTFKSDNSNRREVIYVGANNGILHAFNSDDGVEIWGFVPPLVAPHLPSMVNPGLNKAGKGGSVPIFGVDGSPVAHDVFMKKPNSQNRSWQSILMVPYGRGGSGFSVLDVTNPLVKDGIGPLHMFSVYNDFVNNKVYVMNYNGDIIDGGYEYEQTQFNLSDSREAKKADRNYDDAANADNEGMPNEVYTNRSGIDECKNDSNFTGTNKFMDVGDTSCYSGKTFHFDKLQYHLQL